MIFNLDEDSVVQAMLSSLEDAGQRLSEDQFYKVVETIDEGLPGVIELITYGMADHWRSEAEYAGGWGSKYAQAIKAEFNDGVGEVYLDESAIDKGSNKPYFMFAMMVEEGVKSWSIKDALLKSEKAKVGPSGIKYIIVPFPVATPRTEGQGKMATQFGKREMTQEIYKIVKSGRKVPSDTTLATGENVSGLTKYVTAQRHEQYGIFRCVSEKSRGWQYPNVPPEPVYPSVLEEVNKKVSEVLTSFIGEIVREHSQ